MSRPHRSQAFITLGELKSLERQLLGAMDQMAKAWPLGPPKPQSGIGQEKATPETNTRSVDN